MATTADLESPPSYEEPEVVKKQESNPFLPEKAGQARTQFILKVYGILEAQIGFTVFLSLIFATVPAIRTWAVNSGINLLIVAAVGSIVTLIPLLCYKNVSPANWILLVIFTLCESVMIAMVSAIFYEAGMGVLVIQAFVMTLILFFCLSFVVWYTNVNFSFLNVFLSIGITILLTFSLFSLIFGWQTPYFIVAFAVVLFSLFIVYDTHLIKTTLDTDDYIFGAIILYLDFLNLFLRLLQLLAIFKR